MKINKLNAGDKVTVQAYKSNGTIYRQWDNFIVKKITMHKLYLYGNNITVQEKNGCIWKYKNNVVWIFFSNCFYNCIYFCNKGYEWYCNIASPYFHDGKNLISFIDYDLDVKISQNKSIKVRDIADYESNKITYNYSDKLCTIIENSKNQLVNYARNRTEMFDPNFIQNELKNTVFVKKFHNLNLDDLKELAIILSKQKCSQLIILLEGPIGSGKTAFAKEFCKSLKITKEVLSPTFNLSHEYNIFDDSILSHIDLYRLKDNANFYDLSMIYDIFEKSKIVIIEWPIEKLTQKFSSYLKIIFHPNKQNLDLRDIEIIINNFVFLNLKDFKFSKKNIK